MTLALEYPSRVFADTSAYVSAVNRRDMNHHECRATMHQLIMQRRHIVTTNFVLAEVHALLLTRLNRAIAVTVLREIDASALTTVVRVAARDERRARAIIDQYDDTDFSLTDAISFAVMERLRIRHASTLDRNFAQYGWLLIGPLAHDDAQR
jgi:uncharacterized protein